MRPSTSVSTVLLAAALAATGVLPHGTTRAPAQVAREARTGPVRIEGRAFADDQGAWNPLGATLFWALWGERHDPDRLDRNLAHLAQHRVDYVRILAMVGGPSWADRTIDPEAPDYWRVAERLLTRLARHGLRAHVTIFAEAGAVMPDPARREAFARAWADFAGRHADRLLLLEVANEYWQNGFSDPADVRNLGAMIAARTDVPVALSAPADGAVFRLYGGWPGVATLHHDRSIAGRGGEWRPVWQPWTWPDTAREREGYRGAIPPVVVNNEPIGPEASVEADADPARLALAFAATFIAGHGAYVFHAGAGIRGGGVADQSRGRVANLQDYPPAVLDGLAMMRARLPAGLANWTRVEPDAPAMPWHGSAEALKRGDAVRMLAAARGDRLVAVSLGVARPHTVTARQPVELVVRHPVNGRIHHHVALEAGQDTVLPADLPGYLIEATVRGR